MAIKNTKRMNLLKLTYFIVVFLSLVSIAFGKPKKSYINGYVQVWYTYDFQEGAIPNNEFQIRRARVKVRHYIVEKVRATVEVDCGRGRLIGKDIGVEWEVSRALAFTVGQHKIPFSREQLHSSSRLLVIDRGEVNEVFKDYGYLGRDIGISAQGGIFEDKVPVNYTVGVFNGNGYMVAGDNDNTKQFAERVTFGPVGDVSIGINSTQRADSITRDPRIAYGGDFSFQKWGATVEGEVLFGNVELGSNMLGFYLVALYRLGNFEPALKFERLYPDSRDTDDYSTIYTGNLGWYIHDNIRLQTNLITEVPKVQETNHLFIIQAQVKF